MDDIVARAGRCESSMGNKKNGSRDCVCYICTECMTIKQKVRTIASAKAKNTRVVQPVHGLPQPTTLNRMDSYSTTTRKSCETQGDFHIFCMSAPCSCGGTPSLSSLVLHGTSMIDRRKAQGECGRKGTQGFIHQCSGSADCYWSRWWLCCSQTPQRTRLRWAQ